MKPVLNIFLYFIFLKKNIVKHGLIIITKYQQYNVFLHKQ